MSQNHCTPEVLHLLVDGELSPADERAARAHVAGCARCASQLLSLQRLDAAMRALPLEAVSGGFTASVMSALDPVLPVSRALRFLSWMAFQAGLLVLLLAGLGICAAAGLLNPGGDAPGSPAAGALALLERGLAACGTVVTSLRGDAAHAGPILITISAALVVLTLALVDRILSTRETAP